MLKLRLKRFGRKQRAFYRIVAIDVRARREGRDLQTVGFYDPINNKTDLNVAAILDFLEQGAQPIRTVSDILENAGIFAELQKRRALTPLPESEIRLIRKLCEIVLRSIERNRRAWTRIYEIVSRAFTENP